MKKFLNRHKILLLSACILLNESCTKDFNTDNKDKNAITVITKSEFPLLFNRALSLTMSNGVYYETTQNYYGDIYAQYFAKSVSTERYAVDLTNYVDRLYIIAYSRGGSSLKVIMDNSDAQSPETALSNIVWVYSFSRLTDQLGPIPYSKAFDENSTSIAYDKMEDIYNDFFTRLTNATNTLKALNASSVVFNSQDNLYAGNISKWIKFANTLKLRLAMRISKVNPTKAKQLAEEAIASGVITENADNALVARSIVGNDYNGTAMISTWSATSMSATMKSYLGGYDDPRLPVFFQKRPGATDYKSRRNGMTAGNLALAGNGNADQSIAGPYWVKFNGTALAANTDVRQQVICAAEAYFLRAEAALNGWNAGGTAQGLYEDGIRKSMEQWGISAATATIYINSTNLPSQPNDFHNSPAVSTTPIKWSTNVNEQRKQIGTQKWLAVYPDGIEAWTEFRRTGYPDMYTVLNSDNADLPVGTFIKRLVYHTSEYTRNLTGVQSGIANLNGPDKASTKLWWDVD